jgi:glycosyltransferase involved in cell wall biosynthesis
VPAVTVTVITLNESANLAAALDSVRWADEIVVVDSQSTDETVAIAQRYTDRVIVRPWPGYVDQ